uniref:Uncharacterized protein n=1 Tax=Acrobeloides nanus TaxID=290746 RepID=A0A914BWL8_9BILA
MVLFMKRTWATLFYMIDENDVNEAILLRENYIDPQGYGLVVVKVQLPTGIQTKSTVASRTTSSTARITTTTKSTTLPITTTTATTRQTTTRPTTTRRPFTTQPSCQVNCGYGLCCDYNNPYCCTEHCCPQTILVVVEQRGVVNSLNTYAVTTGDVARMGPYVVELSKQKAT